MKQQWQRWRTDNRGIGTGRQIERDKKGNWKSPRLSWNGAKEASLREQ